MPSALTYPGVYIEEIPSGVRTIIGVATSITALIGRAMRGPVEKAITINSFGDFERIFGGLWAESKLGYAVRDFYLNGGSQAIIVRLFSPTFATAAERQAALTEATNAAQLAAQAVADAAQNASAVAGATAKTVSDAAAAKAADPAFTKQAEKDAAQAVAKAAKDEADKQGATPQSVSQAAAGAVTQAVADEANKAAPLTRAKYSVNNLSLEAAYEGTWGNYLRIRIDKDVSEDVAKSLNLTKADLFNLTVLDTKTGGTEQFRNLAIVKTSPRFVKKVLENESRLLRVTTDPTAVPTAHSDPQSGKDVFADDSQNTYTKVTEQASDGNPLAKADFTGTGKEANKKGLFTLEDADLFNLLCIPPYDNSDTTDKGLIDDALTYCEKRRAMLLVDPPANWKSKDAAKSGIESEAGRTSKNGVIFFPRLKQPDPLRSNQIEEFVPCGAVAGIFARTDASRGVWKAPAGLEATLSGVPELSVPITDAENGELNPKGINCLRTMPAAGRVVWGARTRFGDDRLASEWKYTPVRRTALFIEESLYRGLQWVVFEPNDEPLWAQIRLNVGAFMNTLFRQGAFQGSTPRDAYFVKCDKETTTQNDIDRGIVNIIVGFAPLKPAEFVIIKLQQIAGQIQV